MTKTRSSLRLPVAPRPLRDSPDARSREQVQSAAAHSPRGLLPLQRYGRAAVAHADAHLSSLGLSNCHVKGCPCMLADVRDQFTHSELSRFIEIASAQQDQCVANVAAGLAGGLSYELQMKRGSLSTVHDDGQPR